MKLFLPQTIKSSEIIQSTNTVANANMYDAESGSLIYFCRNRLSLQTLNDMHHQELDKNLWHLFPDVAFAATCEQSK